MAVLYDEPPTSFSLVYAGFYVLLAYGLYRAAKSVVLPWFSPLRKLKHPPNSSLIWGNMREIFKAPDGQMQAAWGAEYGPVFVYRQFLSRWRLCTFDPRALSHILNNAYIYPKPSQVQRNLALTLGEGLLVAEGETHKRQRRIMNPSFSPAQIREVTPIFYEKAYEMRDIWQAQVSAAGDNGVEFNIPKWMSRLTLDIIGLAGFGYPFNTLTDENNELAVAFNSLFRTLRPTLFGVLQNFIPFLRLIPTKRRTIAKSSLDTMHRIGTELVNKKKEAILQSMDGKRSEKDIGKGQLVGRDLLTALVRANLATDVSPAHQLSDAEVLAQISTFLLAGHETTSTAVTWALFALSKHPEVQDKLREELLSVTEEQPSMDDVNALPYLDMVVREVMRYHSPVGGTVRVATQSDTIPVSAPYMDVDGKMCDSIEVRPGDGIFISIKTINRAKSLWGPDADQFIPERWEHIPDEASHVPGVWSHLMSFLGGPRACIGYRFSIIETKAIMFTLLRSFTFEIDPTLEIEERSTIVTRPVIKGQLDKGSQLPLLVRAVKVA